MKTKLNLIGLFITMLSSFTGATQHMDYDRNSLLELRVLSTEVVIMSTTESISIGVSILNKSDTSLILYGLHNLRPGNAPIDIYMQSEMAAATAVFFVRDEKYFFFMRTPKRPQFLPSALPDSASYIGSSIADVGRKLFDQRVTVGSKETWVGSLEIPINCKRFMQGEYDFFMIYYCGVNITNLIPNEKIYQDELMNSAQMFQGFIRTEKIRLIMK